MKKVTLLCAGLSPEFIAKKYGGKKEWFRWLITREDVEFDIRMVFDNESVEIQQGDAWIITGSASSVTDRTDWILNLEEIIRKGQKRGIPMLGICFGHQVIASALGGKVIRNPLDWEVGSHMIALNETGRLNKLFTGIPDPFIGYETHEDVVSELPAGAELLAENDKGIQAFKFGDTIYGVQFHPEFTWEIMCDYSDLRKAQGIRVDCDEVIKTTHGVEILNNFIKYFV